MVSKQMKTKLFSAIALASFVGTAAFGLLFMTDTNMNTAEPMARECPFTMFDGKICPQSVLGVVVHHISLYQSFTNAPANFGMAMLIISSFFVLSAIFAVFINLSLIGNPAFFNIFYNSPPGTVYKRNITRWLALHENSPAVI